MGRAPCCDKANVKKGPWSPEEDAKLKSYIEQNGTGGNWIALPQKIGLKRCGKSCRLRWLNYLRPNLKHGGFTEEEDRIICSLYVSIGSRWSIIAAQLPGRTDNDIKNYWNTRLKKKLFGKQVKEHGAVRRGRGIKQEITKRGIGYPMHHLSSSDNNNNNKVTYWPELPVLAHPIPISNQEFHPNFSFSNFSSLTKNISTDQERFFAQNKPIQEGTILQFLLGHHHPQLSEQQNDVVSSASATSINNMGNQYAYTQYYADGSELPAFQGQSSFTAELEQILCGSSQKLEGLGNLYDAAGLANTGANSSEAALNWVEMSNSLVNPFASNCGTTDHGLLSECHLNDVKNLGVQ